MGLLDSISNAANGFMQAAGSIYSTIQGRKNVKDTIAANKELAEYAYQRDLEMWERGNAYNSPQAQMERLKAAGLNPNLVYGNGAVGNTGAQLPKYNAPNVDYTSRPPTVDLPGILSAYNDFRMKQAQVDNVKANTDAKMVATGIQTAWGHMIKEGQYKNLQESAAYKNLQRYVLSISGDSKAKILSNQATASEYLTEQARLKMEQTLEQNKLIRANTANINYQAIFNKYRAQWAGMGFTSSDNIGFRVIARWMAESGIDLMDVAGKVGKSINP